jgi:hypothetical protein
VVPAKIKLPANVAGFPVDGLFTLDNTNNATE